MSGGQYAKPKDRSRWEPFACRLHVEDLDILIKVLGEALMDPDDASAEEKAAWRRLKTDLEATRSDLWRYLP